mmetsp:Transcript_51347/g.121987  ORF Transcript_51347/g.121987 Transcript_51347/m.121987 type:complete len:124 (+) Transcript_51347:125-496(+)
MTDATLALGFLACLGSALGNGSYYVPVKRHDVYDGLVYQWYQCSGVMLGGILVTMWTNDWANPAGNFYVHWEGLMSGFFLDRRQHSSHPCGEVLWAGRLLHSARDYKHWWCLLSRCLWPATWL